MKFICGTFTQFGNAKAIPSYAMPIIEVNAAAAIKIISRPIGNEVKNQPIKIFSAKSFATDFLLILVLSFDKSTAIPKNKIIPTKFTAINKNITSNLIFHSKFF